MPVFVEPPNEDGMLLGTITCMNISLSLNTPCQNKVLQSPVQLSVPKQKEAWHCLFKRGMPALSQTWNQSHAPAKVRNNNKMGDACGRKAVATGMKGNKMGKA